MYLRIILGAGLMLASTAPAFAHVNPAEHGSFMAGLTHPMLGLDHILAMVTVGLWAAMVGGRAVWAVPGAFVAMMAAGFVFSVSGGALPFVEPVILSSVVVLGLLVALAVRLPVAVCATLVAGFAVFHGYAHGAELGNAAALVYGAGFVTATVVLHALGVGLGIMLSKTFADSLQGERLSRVLGAGTAFAGGVLLLG